MEDEKNDAFDDLLNTPEAFTDHVEKTFDEEKIVDTTSTTSFLSTTISSLDQDELNENLTTLQIENFNKTGLELKTLNHKGANDCYVLAKNTLAQLPGKQDGR